MTPNDAILDDPDFRKFVLSRRRLILAGASTASILSLQGCLPLLGLLRVGLRGRVVSRGLRASRNSRRGENLTIGRLASSAYHLARLQRTASAISRLEKLGQIEATEDQDVAASVATSGDKATNLETSVDAQTICVTEVEGNFYNHNSAYWGGYVGRTVADGMRLIHRGPRNESIGADNYEKSFIEHFDGDGNLIGRTPFESRSPDDDTYLTVTDDSYLRSELARLQDSIDAEEREIFDFYATAVRSQTECLTTRISNCSQLSKAASEALRQAEERFASKA